jgi:hypothetical protein
MAHSDPSARRPRAPIPRRRPAALPIRPRFSPHTWPRRTGVVHEPLLLPLARRHEIEPVSEPMPDSFEPSVTSVRSAPPPPPRSVHKLRIGLALAGLVFGALVMLTFLEVTHRGNPEPARTELTPYFLTEQRALPAAAPPVVPLAPFDHNAAFAALHTAAHAAADRCLGAKVPAGVVVRLVWQPSGRLTRLEMPAKMGHCFEHELSLLWIAPFDGNPTNMTAYVRLR